MMEQTLSRSQTLNQEQGAPFPTEPKPKLTTTDVIIPSEDQANMMAGDAAESKESNFDDIVENGIKQAKRDYQADLDFRVKNVLVTQFFSEQSPTTGAINLEGVATALQGEMQTALDRSIQNVQYLEHKAIPEATVQEGAVFSSSGTRYSKKDVETLYARVEVYSAMADVIQKDLPQLKDEDGRIELAEEYVQRLKEGARKEAIAILASQSDELQRQQANVQERLRALSEGAAEEVNLREISARIIGIANQ